MLSISQYRLSEELYDGSRSTDNRAVREIDSLSVVIKLPNYAYSSFSKLVQICNQYSFTNILKSSKPISLQKFCEIGIFLT
ncbi:MAG: hypothetical protein KAF91_16705 [Nostoc sp. TH1S01]|nr:hypothetical protein [Nostoc sp. TH1S01]